MTVVWDRLIRFVATDGRILRGQPILPHPHYDLGTVTASDALKARVVTGSDIFDSTGNTRVTDEVATVKQLLGPLTPDEVPLLRCIGWNYVKHITETKREPPPFPSAFFKPSTTVLDHNADVHIPKVAQDDQADYEGELCIVIGKDAKDVPVEHAFNYVGGWTVGNDISARRLQINPALAGKVPQFCFSKGFDTFAPLGPCIVSHRLIGDPSKLQLTTRIDGEVRQNEGISDLLFDCAYLISYLSQGTTLQKGSVIMTGTPGGVGNSMKPPRFLVPGTLMEVSISQIGTLRNTVVFD